MALYDVIDEISRKQIVKTPMGDNRVYGVVVATVVDNYNEKMPGRVCISVINRNGKVSQDEPGDILKWARVAFPYFGNTWGDYFLPEVGDQVLCVFEDGNIEKPYIIGAIPRVKSKFLKESVDDKNSYKNIRTRYGNQLKFTDGKYDEAQGQEAGDKDKIEMHTGKKEHNFVMDNDKDHITLSDKDGNNSIDIFTKSDESGDRGAITIKATKKVQILVGDGVKVTMSSNEGGGNILIETGKVTFKVSDGFKVDSSGRVDMSGSGIKVDSTSSLSLTGSASVKIDGGAISIG